MNRVDARRVLAHAALLQDVAGRQLSVLRSTYPAWHIGRERDASGRVWWTAWLPGYTPAMAAAGVMACVRERDAIALAAVLASQSALLAAARPGRL
jgi:hypothetical protein